MKRYNGWIRRIALTAALALLLGAVPVFAKSSEEIREEIRQLEEQAEANQQEMDLLEQQLSDNYSEIMELVAGKDAIDRQIALLHDQIRNLEQRIKAYGQLVADRQDALDEANAALEALREKHKERVRAMEEQGDLSYWSVLFKASSFADLLDRINMILEIAQADQRRLEELDLAAQAVSAAKADLETEKSLLEASREELLDARAQLEEKRLRSDALLAELVKRGDEFQALLDQSEVKQDTLMEQLAQKESELDRAEYLEWLATYVPPVTEEETPVIPDTETEWITPVPWYILTSPFGMRLHPILGYERMHNGVDLACDAGTQIYASRGGRVVTADYQAGGAGNYVQIDHGDGFMSVYMHMTNYIVKEGDYVAPGQVIGYVGNTGLSKGNHLHFGISYNGTYVNPMVFIG